MIEGQMTREEFVKQIEQLGQAARFEIEDAADTARLEEIRLRYLGREQGRLNGMRRGIKDLPGPDRPAVGQAINRVCAEVEERLAARQAGLQASERSAALAGDAVDVTLPGRGVVPGRLHPLTDTIERICAIFMGLGFTVVEGPEIEDDFHNFQALNIPPDHPARDMQATLFLDDGLLLRTHTSPVQIRVMEQQAPPLRVVVPGRVYRRDPATSRHHPVFHQIEGLLVDEDVTFGDLKGVLTAFVEGFFGAGRKIRWRPSYFQFTEPSTEIDVECIMCDGRGCRVCSQTGWMEILGAGMVDPEVFKHVGLDPERYSGFAFGTGVERPAMLKYRVDDIRLFYQNQLSFLRQFS